MKEAATSKPGSVVRPPALGGVHPVSWTLFRLTATVSDITVATGREDSRRQPP
jgi:hypothetical protein